jgi:predicted AlkP superfamily pyrophosphatase or phosphodiesterase
MEIKSLFIKISIVVATLQSLVSLNAFSGNIVRPKLVIGIVVDQMRWDYLYRYYNDYGDGGFKRMMNEGFNCQNTMINYIPSVTAVGHSSIYTGTVPSISGICNNNFYLNGKYIYCCSDDNVNSVGTKSAEGKMSPRNLLVTTIGDELKLATEFKSKVIGVSIKDRAAILPAGHAADGAFWFENATSHVITSSYYMNELPKWVTDFNKTYKAVPMDSIGITPKGNELTESLAKAAISGEQLGKHDVTDMLTVSFSSTDKLGHLAGCHNEKIHQMYIELDRSLADLFDFLDKEVGKGQYVAFLSADHGAANNINYMREHNIPADPFVERNIVAALNEEFKKKFRVTDDLVERLMAYQVRLNRDKISSLGLNVDDVKACAVDILNNIKGIAYAVDLEKASQASIPEFIKTKIINGYNHERGGDIQIIPMPQNYSSDVIPGKGTTHGHWNPYDAHIPFLIMGWHVNHGATSKPTYITDIAPTICALLNIQMPDGCIGNAVNEVIDYGSDAK